MISRPDDFLMISRQEVVMISRPDDFLMIARQEVVMISRPLTRQEKVVIISRPVDQEGHCFLIVDLHPGHVKSLTGIVTWPHEWIFVPQRLNSSRNIYTKE